MELIGLIVLSLVYAAVGLAYLSLDVWIDGTIASDRKVAAIFRDHKKRWIYSVLGCGLMIGLSVWSAIFFPENTFIQNAKLLTLVATLLVLNVTDLRTHTIPNKVIFAAFIVRLVFYIAELVTLGSMFWSVLKDNLFAVLISVAFFVLGVLIMKNGIGMGDIKLIFVMGLYQGLWGTMGSLMYGLVIAMIMAIILLITKKKTRKDSLAFAPSLLAGAVISVLLSGM